MKITYLGHSCFCVETENGTKVITDPYTRVGYELPNGLSADIALISHGHFDHNYLNAVGGSPVTIDSAGEYSVKGVKIKGFDSWHDPKQGALRGKNVIFQFTADGITFCHFGDLGESYCEEIAQKIAGADVWLIPVGGTYTIDANEAWEYIRRLSPKLVIPMHYRPNDGALDITGIEVFLQYAEKDKVISRPNGEYTLNKAELQEVTGKILYMERRK